MNYVEILKQILEVETMENAYCNFISEIVKKGSTLSIILTYELEKIISFLAKEQPTEYQVEKKIFQIPTTLKIPFLQDPLWIDTKTKYVM